MYTNGRIEREMGSGGTRGPMVGGKAKRGKKPKFLMLRWNGDQAGRWVGAQRTGKRAIEEDLTGDWRAQKLACFDNQHHESSTPLAVKKGSYSWPPPASKCVVVVVCLFACWL